ncbi:MAG: DUF5691 domain-containing protein [Zoogloeaceae bacterium]|nr:DUF5691 domain-containing protein [Zoogloeaceae bacterium]
MDSFLPDAASLAALRDCWIVGGFARSCAPEAWRVLLDAAPSAEESERRLLILAGQALEVAFRPALPPNARRIAALPSPSSPLLPEALRPLFRAAQKHVRPAALLWLLEQRGFCAHPLDWFALPASALADEALPDTCAPWQDWREALSTGGDMAENIEELTDENWREFLPATRRLRLRQLRKREPDRARELLIAHCAEETAEERLRLLELLAHRLHENDIPWLQELAAHERSGKVKRLATEFLARLDQGNDPEALLTELADFLIVGKAGLLKRQTIVTPKPLKSPPQLARRQELFESVSLVSLARALEMDVPALLRGWQFGAQGGGSEADHCLARMVLHTASDEWVQTLAARLLAENNLACLLLLAPRLDASLKKRIAQKILLVTEWNEFSSRLRIFTSLHGDFLTAQDILPSPAYQSLKEKALGENAEYALASLSLLASAVNQETARAMLADLNATGIPSAHPALAFLRLNQELADIRTAADFPDSPDFSPTQN